MLIEKRERVMCCAGSFQHGMRKIAPSFNAASFFVVVFFPGMDRLSISSTHIN